MRPLLSILFLIYICFGALAQTDFTLDDKLRELDHVMERRDTYYMAHEHMIDSLKRVAASVDKSDLKAKFDITHKLYNAYRSFQNDSARVYANREIEMARISGEPEHLAMAQYDDLFTYLSRGDFTNAVEALERTDLNGVSDSLKAEFYVQAVRLYSDLSNFTSEKFEDRYARLSHAYSDTVLAYAAPGSYAAQFASNFLYGYSQNRQERIATFTAILNRDDVLPAIKAMLYSMLGDLYISDNQADRGLAMKAQSAIMDVQAATRETTSKHFLAYELYTRGDVDRAARYIHAALEDAENYNAPQRKAEIGRALSLIEASRYGAVNQERHLLWIFLAVTLAFVIIVGIMFFYIRRQNVRLRTSQTTITRQNQEISEANTKLLSLNSQLRESVRIKDEYIGYGFYLNSEYIEKLEEIYKLVSRKITVGQTDDLKSMLRLSDIKREKEKMLKEFDRIFLTLFPTFIEQYQELFPADEQAPTEAADGILTPEMRIFALIRLGVNDCANIARFLNYSVNTLNTYKTKAKKRSTVPNEDFEPRIMQIRSVK